MSEQGGEVDPCTEALAAIDTAHPLPAPPPMCGQTWCWPDGIETMLTRVEPVGPAGVTDVWRVWTVVPAKGVLVSPREVGVSIDDGSDIEAWPPPGAILVAGPSPHGFNVPWSGS